MAELTGYISSVYINPGAVVTVRSEYPTASEYTMDVTQSGATQSVTWHDGLFAIDDTITSLTKTWSSSKISTEDAKKITIPADKGSAGQVLTTDGNNNFSWTSSSGSVASVNGLTGIVTLNSQNVKMADNTTIEDTVNGKITNPTTGTAGQFLKKTTDGVEWSTIVSGVSSVNDQTGAVVLTSSDIKMADATTTLEAAIQNRITKPTTGAVGQVLTNTENGEAWANAPVTTVNNKTGAVVITGDDIAVSSGSTTKISSAILGVQIGGIGLTPSSNIVNIPLAGTSERDANDEVLPGLIRIDSSNGIEVDNRGYAKFNDDTLAVIKAANHISNAAEFDVNKLYSIGDYVTVKGHLYVCMVPVKGTFSTAYWDETSNTKELNNVIEQLIAAVGVKSSKTWDSTNGKVNYNFELNI